ncbi:MAG: hypothetical protein WBP93_12885 [Pyrinomonadaceae bacterium]
MENIFARRAAFVLMALLVVGCCFVDASAQRRRTKRSRRATNPVVKRTADQTGATDTSVSDPTIVSTADEDTESQTSTESTTKTRRATRPRSNESVQDGARTKEENLSDQVRRLSDKLNQMEAQQRTLVDLERLTRAEQRAENLSAQLRDVQAKEADLQARLDILDEAVKPENIERAMAGYGTTHPEELREQRRKQLENERTRVRAQLDQLANSRTRLESAIATADSEVDLLRQRVDATTNNATQNTAAQPGGDNNAQPAPQTQTQPSTQATPPM